MPNTIQNIALVVFFSFVFNLTFSAQPYKTDDFVIEKAIQVTEIKNQFRSNTCWSYATIDMLEAELLKKGKQDIHLSEMFVVYNVYLEKAEKYFRMHGKNNLSGGGALFDVLNEIEKYGIVPYEAYSGLTNGLQYNDHVALDNQISEKMKAAISSEQASMDWKKDMVSILDNNLGKTPSEFTYQQMQFTPKSFVQWLNIKPANYVLFSSFIYKPLYKNFVVDVPDNWSMGQAYNVKLDEMVSIIEYSINNGFTVAATIDNSENGFNWNKGIVRVKDGDPDLDSEPKITAQMRQKAFDEYQTTDDHSLLLIGVALSKNGERYFLAKNSWGTDNTQMGGYLYISEAYIRYKVLTILVNKSGVPGDILMQYNNKCN